MDDVGTASMDPAGAPRDCKVAVPGMVATEAGRSESPEASISTPSYEYQSGFKRLRTGWEEVVGGSEGQSGLDDGPGTSAEVATPGEVLELQERTKAACSELADVIIKLRRER